MAVEPSGRSDRMGRQMRSGFVQLSCELERRLQSAESRGAIRQP
jgi:hypothetical protein